MMMTDADKALEALDSGDINWDMWLFEHSDIIRRALRLLADVQNKRIDRHCVDCCCAKCWDALGIGEYTGHSLPEHITILREENERLKAIGEGK